jgi:uncharacterized membrane protein YphA (DoxX/SURF4 family)
MKAAFLMGRAILGGFFLYNGINHFRQTDYLAQYASSKGVPAAKPGVMATGAAMLVGGASLITGIKPKWGGAAIIGFLAAASPTIHDFWNVEDPQQKQNEMINFLKNLAIAGATLALAGVDEPWEASVPVLQPSRFDRARNLARVATREAQSFGRDAKKFGRDKKKAAKWVSAVPCSPRRAREIVLSAPRSSVDRKSERTGDQGSSKRSPGDNPLRDRSL